MTAALLRAPWLWRARNEVRKWADTHVERPIARALTVGTALRRSAPDVLMFGDSTFIHVSPDDADKRRLGEMFADVSGRSTLQYYGPAYTAGLWGEFIRLIGDLPRPRCVVLGLQPRSVHYHVTDHPVFGYRRALEAMGTARRIGPGLGTKLYKQPPTPADYAKFEAIERESPWNLARTVGEYRRRLRGYDVHGADDDAQRLMLDYLHGETCANRVRLPHWRILGERLRDLGVPVVAYRTYIPYDNGRRVLGDDFVAHMEANYRIIEEEFFGGLGSGKPLTLDPPPDSAFIYYRDFTEHMNESGRRRLVDAIIAGVNDVLN